MIASFINLDYNVKQAVVICASLLLSIFIAYISTPFAIKFARKIGAVDVPADERRMHNHPIPLLGGLAIIVAFTITSIVMIRYHHLLWQILPGALIITVLGIIDDKYRLPAWPKFFVQCVAAAIPIIINPKILINSITGFSFFGVHPITFSFFFSVVITILWIVGITNAVNLVDGLDGLAAGISTIASISMLLIAVIKMGNDTNEYGVAILTAALAGGCMGLLPYNRNPAKVFMGDTGATFLGYTLAVISIQGLFKAYTAVSFAVPLLVLGLPILDTIVAIVRRLAHHKSPFAADRSHIHHKLIDLGLDQKQAVALLYTVSATMGIVAVVFAAFGSSTGWLFLLAAAALIATICILVIPLCQKHNLFGSNNFDESDAEQLKDPQTDDDHDVTGSDDNDDINNNDNSGKDTRNEQDSHDSHNES